MTAHDEPDESTASSATMGEAENRPSTGYRSSRHARKQPRKQRGSFWREIPVLVVVALGLALVIKAFLVQAFYIPSDSMMNTLKQQDRVLVNKVVYRLRDIHRGEVVVFEGKDSWAPEVTIPEPSNPLTRGLRWLGGALGLAQSGERDFIKRVVAVGGDTVACCDEQGRVTVNGRGVSEPYVFENSPLENAGCTSREFGPVRVPEGRLWVMGDHRSMSSDSRCHVEDRHRGTISESSVIGRAFVIVWPLGRAQTLAIQSGYVGADGASQGADRASQGADGASLPAASVATSLPYLVLGAGTGLGALRGRVRRHRTGDLAGGRVGAGPPG